MTNEEARAISRAVYLTTFVVLAIWAIDRLFFA